MRCTSEGENAVFANGFRRQGERESILTPKFLTQTTRWLMTPSSTTENMKE